MDRAGDESQPQCAHICVVAGCDDAVLAAVKAESISRCRVVVLYVSEREPPVEHTWKLMGAGAVDVIRWQPKDSSLCAAQIAALLLFPILIRKPPAIFARSIPPVMSFSGEGKG